VNSRSKTCSIAGNPYVGNQQTELAEKLSNVPETQFCPKSKDMGKDGCVSIIRQAPKW